MPANNANIQKTNNDKRVIRTRLALRNALLALIKEKEYDLISVEEIVDRANLVRATFYLHYRDKDDLLLEEFREIARDRVQVLSEIPISILRQDMEVSQSRMANSSSTLPILLVFEHVAQNEDLYRMLLKGKNSQFIATQMHEIIAKAINQIIQIKYKNEFIHSPILIPIDFLATYFSGAMMSSIKWYLDQEKPFNTIEMAKMFQTLFFPGLIAVLSDPNALI